MALVPMCIMDAANEEFGKHEGPRGPRFQGRTEHITDEEIAIALKETHGLHWMAAQLLNATASSIKSRIRRSSFLQSVQEEAHEEIGDHAEMAVFNAVKNQKLDAAKFFLTTKAKERGYSTKQEDAATQLAQQEAKRPKVDLSNLTPDQLKTLLNAMNQATNQQTNQEPIDAEFTEIKRP